MTPSGGTARWAPSASDTQPSRFAVTVRGSAEHAAVLEAPEAVEPLVGLDVRAAAA